MFFALAFVLNCFGQKEIIYGTVRTDGYQNIKKGAKWADRPEAKEIYQGGHPAGYTIHKLEEDYFVRFVDGENNELDRNYIVFPKDSIVYTDTTGQFYSAKCGNKIEYIRSVNMVSIQPQVASTAPIINNVTVNVTINMDSLIRNYLPPQNPDLGLVDEEVESKSWMYYYWPLVVGMVKSTAINIIVVGEYHDWGKKPSSVAKTETGQGVDPPPNLGYIRNIGIRF